MKGGDYRDLISKRAKQRKPIACLACGREFVPRHGQRKYCYEPACELSRERKKSRHAAERARKKKEKERAEGKSRKP